MTSKGQVSFEGIGSAGTITYTALVAPGVVDPTGIDYGDEADVSHNHNRNGEVTGMAFRNARQTLTIEAYPTSSASPGVAADALKALVLPTKGSVVTLANFADTDLNGSWFYEQGARKRFSSDGRASITIPLVKYEHFTSVSLATTV